MTSSAPRDVFAPRQPLACESATDRPTLARRQPEQIPVDEIGEQHQPEVSADEMQHILFALMEQQTR